MRGGKYADTYWLYVGNVVLSFSIKALSLRKIMTLQCVRTFVAQELRNFHLVRESGNVVVHTDVSGHILCLHVDRLTCRTYGIDTHIGVGF